MTRIAHQNSPIVIRLPNWIGDACMALPAITRIQAQGYSIVLVGLAWAENLFAGLQAIEFIPVTQDQKETVARLKKYKRSNALIFPNSFSSAWLFFKVGLRSVAYRTDGRRLLLQRSFIKPVAHEVEVFYQLSGQALKTWGHNDCTDHTPNKPLHLPLIDKHQQTAMRAVNQAKLPKQFVLLAPNATGKHQGKDKAWPYFNQLTLALQAQGICCVICPPNNEKLLAQQSTPSALCLDSLSLGAFAALCQQASLVICNDSGISHIASSVSANQITLFGVTERTRTGPWSNTAVCLGSSSEWPTLDEVIQTTTFCLNQTYD